MKITLPRLKTDDLLFYIAYGVFLIFSILSTSFYYQYFNSVFSLIKYACIAVLFIREVRIHKYSIKSLLIGVVFIILIIITRYQSSMAIITYILIFVFCARSVDFKGIVRFSAWVSSVVVLFIVASAYIGIIPNYVSYSATRIRYYLGFRHTTYGPAFLFNITCLFIYSGKNKIKWFSLIILTALNYWMFIMTRSRLSFVLSILIILVAGFLKLFPQFFEHKHVICMTMVLSFILCCGISLYFTITYDSSVSWENQLNKTLEGRLSLGQSALQDYGVTLFGQELVLVGNGLDEMGKQNTEDDYNYVDSFYEQILLRYGIVFTVIIIALLTYTMYYFYKKDDYWLLLWLTVVAGHSILAASINLHYCTFWFAISAALFSTREEE